MSDFQFRCPKCHSTDRLRVTVSAEMDLIQNSEDDVETYDGCAFSDHEWDSDSPMYCGSCDHRATVGDFATDADQLTDGYKRGHSIAQAIDHLKHARELLRAAKAPHTLARVRLALTSAGGALRHAQGLESR